MAREAIVRLPLTMRSRNTYHHRRGRNPWGRRPKLEMALTVFTVVAVIVALLVFLLVYHDLPFRLSGGY